MAVRIYALAKELKIDNKKLVDICTKAGITGKGSALASLTDEEVVRLKAYLSGGKGSREGATTAGSARPDTGATLRTLRREDYIAPTGSMGTKVPVLPTRPSASPPLLRKRPETASPAPAEPVVEIPPPAPLETTATAPVVEEEPAVAAIADEVSVEPAVDVPEPVAEAPAPPQPPTMPPPGPPSRVPALPAFFRPLESRMQDRKPSDKRKTEKKPSERKSGDRPKPSIHLAPLPPAAKPRVQPKSQEPAPQKPDIKLPLDAIRAGRAGAKPLSEHLKKHEEKRREEQSRDEAAKKGGRRATPPAGAAPVPILPASGDRDRSRRARGGVGEIEGEPGKPGALGGREQRQLKRKKSSAAKRRGGEGEDDGSSSAYRRTHIRRSGTTNTAAPRKGKVVVQLPLTVRSFSEAVGVPARTILGKLLSLGMVSNIAASLDAETAELLAAELGLEVDLRREVALEDMVLESQEQADDPSALELRPPIVTFLGHVDHGKTSLLDRLIGIDVAAHEKGGITQHIRAYKIEKDGRPLTFVDTPGHEAFTEMRARGANVTDIAVLVVAADDGVMPQTEEAISHARAAGVPIVIALNKIDLPGIKIDRIYQQLAVNELLPSEWGGETELVKTSATTGEGMDQLLETLLTVAELHEYKANPARPARGTCLEAEMQEDRGVIVKVIVQSGTLHVGDVVVCGPAYGRVKAMYDTLRPDKRYEEVGPSTPVNLTGLNIAPGAGDRFHVLSDISQARELAEQRASDTRQRELSGGQEHVTLENLYERLGRRDEVQTLNIILRADVRGSIEAIRKEIGKLAHPEVQIRILQATVGGITEADVHLADASDAVIIGFSVVADEAARQLAESRGVQIRRYDIIYQVTGDLKAALEGMLRPEKQEKELGRALVQQVFHISRIGSVAGCRVMVGTVSRDARVRVIRDSRVIGDYALETLRREKDDAREVREGMECGIKLAGFNDVKEGDILEAYKIEEVRRTLADAAAT